MHMFTSSSLDYCSGLQATVCWQSCRLSMQNAAVMKFNHTMPLLRQLTGFLPGSKSTSSWHSWPRICMSGAVLPGWLWHMHPSFVCHRHEAAAGCRTLDERAGYAIVQNIVSGHAFRHLLTDEVVNPVGVNQKPSRTVVWSASTCYSSKNLRLWKLCLIGTILISVFFVNEDDDETIRWRTYFNFRRRDENCNDNASNFVNVTKTATKIGVFSSTRRWRQRKLSERRKLLRQVRNLPTFVFRKHE